jgi:hypothetical protein
MGWMEGHEELLKKLMKKIKGIYVNKLNLMHYLLS